MPCLAREIGASVKASYDAQTPINIAGAGTKLFLNRPPENRETLDVTGHNGIIEYDPAELVLLARAGTPLRDIEQLLYDHRQMLGFEPPFIDDGATIGGAVAAGLAGPRRAYAGAVRDFMLGVTFVNGRGESITAGGKVMKNVAGFDLFRPMARSMGTLGVLLSIALRVSALPEVERTVLHEEDNEHNALKKMNRWPRETQAISAACWDGRYIRIRLSGSEAGIEHAHTFIGGQWIDGTGYWRDLNNFKLDFFRASGRLWRVCVAPMSVSIGKNGVQLIDWGGAQRWLKSDEPPATIRSLAAELGGYAECFSDDPAVETFHPLDNGVAALNQRFKHALDPAAILNPGRLYPEL
jgi:glycolate oxidase FAD binding subunit